MKHTQVIILAAGKGTRMNTEIPKALVKINGKAMLGHVLDAVNDSGVDASPIVVYGQYLEEVCDYAKERGASCALQKIQNGTADAAAAALKNLSDETSCVAVMNGDNPFISANTIQKIVEYHDQKPCPIIVAIGKVDSYEGWQRAFNGFGRIIRDKDGLISYIREVKDANDEERAVKEVNSAFYVFDRSWLEENISKIKNKNVKEEYYLTDAIQIAVDQGLPVRTFEIPIEECVGVNRLEERDIAEEVYKRWKNK